MHIAQFNAAKANHPLDHPSMREFVDNLDRVNQAAREWSGFVWKFQDETGHSAYIRTEENPDMVINLSVWDSVESLVNFLRNSVHRSFYLRRRNWFQEQDEAHAVLWWVPVGYYPSLEEAWDRLKLLRAKGPTPEAFTFARVFPPEEAAK